MKCKIIIVLLSAITTFAAHNKTVSITACCTDCTLNKELLHRLILVRDEKTATTHTEFDFNVTYSGFNCSFDGIVITNSYANTAFELIDNGVIWPGMLDDMYIPLMNSTDYCIEENGRDVTARLCYEDKCKGDKCIKKCCPEGKILNHDAMCIPDPDDTFRLPNTFMDENMDLVPLQNESFTVLYNYLPLCDSENRHHMYSEEYETVYFLTSGGIVVRGIETEEFHTKYCVDHIKQKDGTFKMSAVGCTTIYHDTFAVRVIKNRIFPVVMLMSTLLLLLTFVLYAMLPELRCIGGKIVMCHVLPLWISFTIYCSYTFLAVDYDPRLKYMCVITATMLHFTYLAALNWLSVMAFDVFWTFRNPDESDWYWNEMIFGRIFSFAKETEDVTEQPGLVGVGNRGKDRRKFALYSAFAWGYATLVVLVGFVSDRVRDHTPDILPSWFIHAGLGEFHCFFDSHESFWLYLYGPLILAMVFNITMFALTVPKVSQQAVRLSQGHHTWPTKERFLALVKLSLLMGLMWLVKWVSIYLIGSSEHWVAVFSAILLMPIGTFLLFVWKQKVLELLAARYSFVRRVLGNSAYKRPSTSLNLKPSSDESSDMLNDN